MVRESAANAAIEEAAFRFGAQQRPMYRGGNIKVVVYIPATKLQLQNLAARIVAHSRERT
jgi:hypothetical protein